MDNSTLFISIAIFIVYILVGVGFLFITKLLKNDKRLRGLFISILFIGFVSGIILLGFALADK